MPKSSFTDSAPSPLLFYDGVCTLCNSAVKKVIESDPVAAFHFAPLQGETAAKFYLEFPELRDVDSLILWDGGQYYTESDAAWRTAALCSSGLTFWKWIRFIPKPIRDWGYRRIASIRYRVFGKYDACPLPPLDLRARFLP